MFANISECDCFSDKYEYENSSLYDSDEYGHQIISDPFEQAFSEPKLTLEEPDDDNYEKNYFQPGYNLNRKDIPEAEKLTLNDNKKTKPTTMTNQIKEKKEEENEVDIQNLNDEKISIKPKSLLKKKKGRKNKVENDNSNDESVHDKKKEDNMMRKIKTNLHYFFVKILNKSLKFTNEQFYKIDKNLSENLKRDFNLELMQRTLLDIFSKSKTNGRYKNHSNDILIKNILEEKKEKGTIKLLEMKYIEVVNEIQENFLKDFLSTIEIKENSMKNSSVDEYMKNLEKLFMGYEDWFKNKNGRNRESKVKQA